MLTPFNDVCRPEDRTPPGWTMRTSGFWAQVHDPSAIDKDSTLALTGTDCGYLGYAIGS